MKNIKLWDWVVWNRRLKTKIKWKTVKIIEHFMSSKKIIFFLCVYKMDSFAVFTANVWTKSNVEVIEYGGKIWINQGHLQEKLGIVNIADRTQYYSDEFKKTRCEIQECYKYQPCRMFIENNLAVEITMSKNMWKMCKNTSSYFQK